METKKAQFSPRSGKDFGKGAAWARSIGAKFDPATKTWSASESTIVIGSYGRTLSGQLAAHYCRLVEPVMSAAGFRSQIDEQGPLTQSDFDRADRMGLL